MKVRFWQKEKPVSAPLGYTPPPPVRTPKFRPTPDLRWVDVKEQNEYKLQRREQKYIDFETGDVEWRPVRLYTVGGTAVQHRVLNTARNTDVATYVF